MAKLFGDDFKEVFDEQHDFTVVPAVFPFVDGVYDWADDIA